MEKIAEDIDLEKLKTIKADFTCYNCKRTIKFGSNVYICAPCKVYKCHDCMNVFTTHFKSQCKRELHLDPILTKVWSLFSIYACTNSKNGCQEEHLVKNLKVIFFQSTIYFKICQKS